jgi:ubiquinone/menaquinone biosynthesis C-methylase UbiE
LADPLPEADVLVMGRILHNWDVATRKLLLEKAYRALKNGGAVIVYDPEAGYRSFRLTLRRLRE